MTYRDPRLTDVQLLRLAAWSLAPNPRPRPAWEKGEGLASLLDEARRCGVQDLPAVDDDALPTTSMGRLLAEARAWQREHDHGA